jgi:hypothetical protein
MAASIGRTVLLNGVDLGPTGLVSSFNESALPKGGQLGQIYEADGKFYRLVQFDNGDAVASAAGNAAYWKTKSSYIVTSDESASEGANASGENAVAGGFLGVLTDQYYGFIQMGGDQASVYVDNAVAGSMLSGGTTDGQLVETTAGTTGGPVNKLVAIALGTDDTNRVTVRWEFMHLI